MILKNILNVINEGLEKELLQESVYATHNYELAETLLREGGTSRIYNHITGDKDWAIISPYRSNMSKSENEKRMKDLKSKIKKLGYGYTELKSTWSETDKETGEVSSSNEYSLLISGIGKKEAMGLGMEFEQSSIVVKDGDNVTEICTTPFKTYDGKNMNIGDIVRTFNSRGNHVLNIDTAEKVVSKEESGFVSIPTQGGSRPFSLSESILESIEEVEPPRASYFRDKEIFIPIYKLGEKIKENE